MPDINTDKAMQRIKFYGSNIIPKRILFNRFFSAKTDMQLFDSFQGLCFTGNFYKKSTPYDTKHRYIALSCGQDIWRMFILGPMFLGFCGSFMITLFAVIWPFYDEPDPFPWWMLISLLIWNITFCNLIPILSSWDPKRCAYFDRKTGKVGYNKQDKDNEFPERDEHGNPCFAWDDIIATFALSTVGHGQSSYVPTVHHKDPDKQKWTKVFAVVGDSSTSPVHCFLFWERIVRFMDNTQPLADIPEFEHCRHLDPVTAEFDKNNNRPQYYWRNMSFKQQQKISDFLLNEAFHFDFKSGEPRSEITKPWEKWPIDLNIEKEELNFKYKAKRIFLQLTCAF